MPSAAPPVTAERPPRRRTHRLAPSLDFARTRIPGEVTVRDMAAVVHFSAFHYHRLFGSTFGEAAGEYVRRARLERAATLIRAQPGRDLAAIARDAGFGYASSLTRAFKARFGLPPARWRERFAGSSGRRMPGPAASRVRLEQVQARRLVGLLLPGRLEPDRIAAAVSTLTAELDRIGIPLGEIHLLTWDDPAVTPAPKARFEVLTTVPEGLEVPRDLLDKRSMPGRIARSGPVGGTSAAVSELEHLTRRWLPSRRLRPAQRPSGLWLPDPRPGRLGPVYACAPVESGGVR